MEFENGQLKVEKDNTYFNGVPIFNIYELVNNSWHFCTKISAPSYEDAYKRFMGVK